MRYRKLDSNGDYTFGHGQSDFWIDQVEGVGQAVKTRLLLFFTEWFLDQLEGTRWGGFPISDEFVRQGRILAENTLQTRDLEVQQRILGTQGVLSIDSFSSNFDSNPRAYYVNAIISTIYGQTAIIISGNVGTGVQAVVSAPPIRRGAR